jgi:hypothetical protein
LARDTFESLSKLSSVLILNQISKLMFSELSFIHPAGNNVTKSKEQCRQMLFVNWIGEAPLRKMDSL